ncbi:prepilin-type N-terminal cleavage/methylation domain-containing protein [Cryobacterium sp. TMT4-31]|uniref:type IV pilus modification PilV family protein n=1 Tax=Cryobacterium sp. TMT4-31 TaxID=1259259 RepID=UPI00106CA1E7|nr:prepilin-type N-terminal cleavage/methylation domain-containing protein [Cryobacterium sp. TMT4-31]TFC91453.1 type II secretion system protein [Cryobacterium sp. TMT4-31]
MESDFSPRRIKNRDDGFGLIEIVVSMFLLGLLAIAFLPLLVTSMTSTVINSSVATATQLVNDQMDQARTAGDTCALIEAYEVATVAAVPPDARGVSYQPTRSVSTCPLTYPGTVRVTVAVSVVGSTIAPATATTRVYLKSA